MTNEKKDVQGKTKKNLFNEIFKIFVTALTTSIATCCVWGIQTRSENEREDKYKKIELVQDYVEVLVKYEQTYQLIIDNKQMWMQTTFFNEYNYKIDSTYEKIDTSEFEEKEEIYRKEYREILAEYMGLLSTIDIMFETDKSIDTNAQKAQEELQKGFGFEYDKYAEYFWTQVDAMGESVSEQEMQRVMEELDRMSDEDTVNKFVSYSQQYMNNLRELIK